MERANKLKFDTICVKENIEIGKGTPHVLPIHATSAFSYNKLEDSIDVFTGKEKGYVYSRFANPTVHSVELKLAQLEAIDSEKDAYCVMTSSGLAAISTLCISLLSPGDALLTQADLYGGTSEIFSKIMSKYGVEVILANLSDVEEVEQHLQNYNNIKLLYCESPSNPTLGCINLKQLADLTKNHNVLTAVDNTFCTSYIQRPMSLGIDFVVYSTTKFINGHGNGIAGAIITMDEEHRTNIWTSMKLMGTNCNPFDAWLVHNGLKTMSVRLDRHCSNAMAIAQYLEKHKLVNKVNYPGLESFHDHEVASMQMDQFGGMLSFEIDGGMEAAKRFMNSTELCSITSTLGNVDTLLLHPATSSHLNIDKAIREDNGITDGLVRMSVGIENVHDIISDIELGLE